MFKRCTSVICVHPDSHSLVWVLQHLFPKHSFIHSFFRLFFQQIF